MSASPRDSAGLDIATQENLLLDATERIGRIRDGRVAVHLHLSRLKAQNRQEGYLRVASRMLEPMISAYGGQIFLLSNADIVFFVNQPNAADLRDHLHRLRGLFAKDPLTSDDSGDGTDRFCSLFDLTYDYDFFLPVVQAALAEVRAQARKPNKEPEQKPLDTQSLHRLLERLSAIDASQFIRRQSAIALGGQGPARVIFQEFFVSLPELQRAAAPDLQLQANRWMFQHLSSILDQRVLAALQRMRLTHPPPAIHVNLGLASLNLPAFQAFDEARTPGVSLGIGLRILEILADSRGFFAARARLREKGVALVIDGLDEATLRFMDVSKTDADLYKIEWSPELQQPDRSTALINAVRHIDPDKLLLTRCDSENAIAWGVDHGITQFQGRHVEAMLAATTMGLCDKSAPCSLAQCTQRHGVISGSVRHECGNLSMLDRPPPMRPPTRGARPKAGA